MAAIKGKNTRPEMAIRHIVYNLGYRYRLHERSLPGRPDIVFSRRRKIIDVRGCFWHQHPGCAFAATPKTRQNFWQAKFSATMQRDRQNLLLLASAGWQVLIVWECEVGAPDVAARLVTFLGPRRVPEEWRANNPQTKNFARPKNLVELEVASESCCLGGH